MNPLPQFKRVAAVASIYVLSASASPYATAADPCRGWRVERHPRLMADINKDGKSDIVGFGDDGVWTALATGDGSFEPAKFVLAGFGVNQAWDPSKHVRLMADINNDGKADIVGFGDDGVWTALATGDGGFATANFVLAGFGVNQAWDPSKHVRVMADINNDAKADIVGFGDAGVATALATGDGSFSPANLVLGEIFGCAGRFDFNLEWSALSPGGFPLNPRWRWQRDNPGVPSAGLCHYFSKPVTVNGVPFKFPDFADCTDQTDLARVDVPSGFHLAVCQLGSGKAFPGHLNWFAATFTGTVTFGDHNYDEDYYLALRTDGAPGIISGDDDPPRSTMHTEFNSDETVDYFLTSWWTSFRDAVNTSKAAGKKMMTDRPAIMTGLFGVDFEHEGGKSELHPVYAMAVNVSDEPGDNVWAIFVRNTGDEGYCSHRNWPAEFTTYTFRLPWREGMNSVEVLRGPNQSQFAATAGTSGPAVVYTPGQGVDVTFTLPPPSQTPLIEGELHLLWRWPLDQPPVASPRRAPAPNVDIDDEAEPVREAINRLPPGKRRQVEKARHVGEGKPLKLHKLPPVAPATEVKELAALPSAAVRLGNKGELATRKIARDAAQLRALCEVWNGSPPGLPPDVCAKVAEEAK
jgi:hypothetical protein